MDHPVRDKANPASFSPPLETVHEAVKTVPYSERAANKRAQTESLKGKGKPLGGAEPIPEGKLAELTMARPVFEDEVPPPINKEEARQARQQPTGVGSAYPVNQALAAGEIKKPVTLAEANAMQHTTHPPPEVAKAMQQMDTAAITAKPDPRMDPEPARPAMPSNASDRADLDESDKDLERSIDLDIKGLSDARGSLMSEKRRKEIESRLGTLDIGDMITNKEIQQTVPVVPGRFELTLRTLSQKENLYCLQYVYEFPGSEAYVYEMHNTAKLVCSLVGINGATLPDHRINVGEREEDVDREKFVTKMGHVIAFPVQLMADISVQLIWFNNRVNELFNVGNLKNG